MVKMQENHETYKKIKDLNKQINKLIEECKHDICENIICEGDGYCSICGKTFYHYFTPEWEN